MSFDHIPIVDDILSKIRYLSQQNYSLELTKSFRGMMVQQDVDIIEVNPDDVTFRARNTAMLIALEGAVYLNGPIFHKPVIAHLKSVNHGKGMFVLTRFNYIDSEWKMRQNDRVQPKQPKYVNIHWKGETTRAYMENISVNGMGVLVYKHVEKGITIQPGSNIQLDFQLSPTQKYAAVKGSIVYLNKLSGLLAMIGIRLFPKAKEARGLEEFISRCKQEIAIELNQAFWNLSTPRGVESLYF
jgi:hypothetical protein